MATKSNTRTTASEQNGGGRFLSEQQLSMLKSTIEHAIGYLDAISICSQEINISPGCPGIEACARGVDYELCVIGKILGFPEYEVAY